MQQGKTSNEEQRRKARAIKRAIHRQYGYNRHCHGVALFVDTAMFNDYRQ